MQVWRRHPISLEDFGGSSFRGVVKNRCAPFQVYLWRREDLEDLASSASPNKGQTGQFFPWGETCPVSNRTDEISWCQNFISNSTFYSRVGNLDGESYVAAGAGRLRLACGTSNRFCDLDLVVWISVTHLRGDSTFAQSLHEIILHHDDTFEIDASRWTHPLVHMHFASGCRFLVLHLQQWILSVGLTHPLGWSPCDAVHPLQRLPRGSCWTLHSQWFYLNAGCILLPTKRPRTR